MVNILAYLFIQLFFSWFKLNQYLEERNLKKKKQGPMINQRKIVWN